MGTPGPVKHCSLTLESLNYRAPPVAHQGFQSLRAPCVGPLLCVSMYAFMDAHHAEAELFWENCPLGSLFLLFWSSEEGEERQGECGGVSTWASALTHSLSARRLGETWNSKFTFATCPLLPTSSCTCGCQPLGGYGS